MDPYRQLRDSISSLMPTRAAILQGIVKSVSGITCTVTVGNIDIPDVRLRASELEDASHILITPKVGSPVILGSLGGLINIAQLTDKLNALVRAFNAHTHSVTVAHPGGTFTTLKPKPTADNFNKDDYEDPLVTH